MPTEDKLLVHYIPELSSTRTACSRESVYAFCTPEWEHVTCSQCKARLAEDVVL